MKRLLLVFSLLFLGMGSSIAAPHGSWSIDKATLPGKYCIIDYSIKHRVVFSILWSDRYPEKVWYSISPAHVDYSKGFNVTFDFVPSKKSYIYHATDAHLDAGTVIIDEPIKGGTLLNLLQNETGVNIGIFTMRIDPDAVIGIPLVPAANALSDLFFCKAGKSGSGDEDTEEKE